MIPLKVTLDNTCSIDLEQNNEYAHPIKELIRMHCEREIDLRVAAISASELKPKSDRTDQSNFNEFKQRIASIGLSDVKILPTLGRWNLSSWDHFVWGGRWLYELEKEIQAIMFPGYAVEYRDFCKKHGYDKEDKDAWRKWVNKKCDVLALWSHIWYSGDIFVTRDSDFHKATIKPKLTELGAGKILTPAKAVKMLDC